MSGFTLDTSGAVETRSPPNNIHHTFWPDLSPFEQGYVEALFASLPRSGAGEPHIEQSSGICVRVGFSDLAPSTLAAIRKDCADYCERYPDSRTPEQGAAFWNTRNANALANWFAIRWPPQTPTLGDDGRVYLGAA